MLECNDGYLNDIQRMVLGEADYRQASAEAQAKLKGAVKTLLDIDRVPTGQDAETLTRAAA